MAIANVHGVRIFYDLNGIGSVPLVLVHGSWDSHHGWDLVVPALADSFTVLTYDRRGHSESERPTGQGSMREDVADLAALIENLGLGPAWVAGNSFGASIAFQLAVEHPELLRGVIAHDPPLFSLLVNDPSAAAMLDEGRRGIDSVVALIASGDHAGAAEHFIDTMVLGPGAWAHLPADDRQMLIENAPTFLDEANDPEQFAVDIQRLATFRRPILLTTGAMSPPVYGRVVSVLADALPTVKVHRLPEAGHVPQVTDPDAYSDTLKEFIKTNAA